MKPLSRWSSMTLPILFVLGAFPAFALAQAKLTLSHNAEAGTPRAVAALKFAELVSANASFRERLHAMLGSEDGGFEPYIKLWREAQVLADKDPEIKSAYLLTMRMWHEETAAIISQGQKAGEFSPGPDAADVAWRLIALVCGLDGIYVLGIEEMADPAFERHLDRMITLELVN